MRQWMSTGTEDEIDLKVKIHRFLALPETLPESIKHDDAQELLMAFAFHYVDALLTYCSDELKPTYFILEAKTTKQFKRIPLGKVHFSPLTLLTVNYPR